MFWGMRLPGSVFADEGVCQDHELSGDGDDGGLGRLSLCDEALEEGLESGIETRCGECSQVEDTAHGGPSSPDDAHSFTLARVVGDRREAGQQGDLSSTAAAELGQAGDERCCDPRAAAWNRRQDGIASGQAVVGLDGCHDLALDRRYIFGIPGNATLEVTLQELAVGRCQLVFESRTFGDGTV